MHRVGGREAEHAASRTSECLQQLLDDLVGSVGRPDLRCVEVVPQVAGERVAQRGELAIGVAVDGEHRGRETLDDVPGDALGDGVRVLVDVEGVAHVLLRRAVRTQTAEVVTDREIVERGHR